MSNPKVCAECGIDYEAEYSNAEDPKLYCSADCEEAANS